MDFCSLIDDPLFIHFKKMKYFIQGPVLSLQRRRIFFKSGFVQFCLFIFPGKIVQKLLRISNLFLQDVYLLNMGQSHHPFRSFRNPKKPNKASTAPINQKSVDDVLGIRTLCNRMGGAD